MPKSRLLSAMYNMPNKLRLIFVKYITIGGKKQIYFLFVNFALFISNNYTPAKIFKVDEKHKRA